MGATHATALTTQGGGELTAVCASDDRRLQGDLSGVGGNLGATFGQLDFSAVKKYRDWRDLVADKELDIVDICLPTEFHAPVALAAFESGKHVFCEKPMALTEDDCRAMIAASRRASRLLMIGQVLRFFPQYKRLKDAVINGEWGAIRSATFTRRCGIPQWSKWLTDEARSGGALIDLMVHDVDQALWLFGLPDRVAAKSIGEPDTVMATLIYPSGPEVRIQGGWFAPETPFSMAYQARFDRALLDMTLDGVTLSDAEGKSTKLELPGGDPYSEQLRYFLRCCETNEEPALCRPQESANAVKVALLLKESRASGGEQLKCSV